jgi:hypothetical protein
MIDLTQRAVTSVVVAVALWCQTSAVPFSQSEPDGAAVIRSVDASVQRRFQNVLGFTDIEHYAVFRGKDETHPVAELTVKDTYKKGVGKSYEVQSESGSAIVQRFGLRPLLDNEKTVNLPGNVEQSWFDSANYDMKLKTGSLERLDGRDCYALEVTARQKASNTINGEIWVDAKDGSTVKIDGIASKNPSAFAGATHMMRQYIEVESYPMATHARAESTSALFGRTIVTIDYSEYHLELAPAK